MRPLKCMCIALFDQGTTTKIIQTSHILLILVQRKCFESVELPISSAEL